MVGRAWAGTNEAYPQCTASLTHAKPKTIRHGGVHKEKKRVLMLLFQKT
jgi:hypothetical protein